MWAYGVQKHEKNSDSISLKAKNTASRIGEDGVASLSTEYQVPFSSYTDERSTNEISKDLKQHSLQELNIEARNNMKEATKNETKNHIEGFAEECKIAEKQY